MISKINKIKDLGLVFADFTWNTETTDFKAVNLIYGWNGCGKTTLTRLFDIISSPPADTKVEFEVEDETGAKFTLGTPFPRPIRVFNQDYIQKNVRILESSANTISVTGLRRREGSRLAFNGRLERGKKRKRADCRGDVSTRNEHLG